MISFLVALAALIAGYMVYGTLVDRVFGPSDRKTPAVLHNDGVDYIPLPTWKVFLIQLLNIAGLGPIFGALGGALWGPSVYFWIVLGTIFAGGVHDYLSGMMSMREDGHSISEIVGNDMGKTMLTVMRIFSVILLVLVGTVFMTGPAMLLSKLTGWAVLPWLIVVLGYYFLATILPIDKIIARLYPIFGICLIIMAIGIAGGMLLGVGGHVMPEMVMANLYPGEHQLPIWPLMFITVACGAVSGFHSTQSPLMARCLKDERLGRPVFYGAMVAEGVIALIWAAAGITFFDGTAGLQAALKAGGPGGAVYEICTGYMGTGIGAVLAMIVLWTGAVYLYKKCEKRLAWVIPCVPATFMSVVTFTYILQAKEGFQMNPSITYPAGLAFGALCLALFLKNTVMNSQVKRVCRGEEPAAQSAAE